MTGRARRLIVSLALVCGCGIPGLQVRQEPFLQSSLAVNRGRPHLVELGGAPPPAVADRLIELGRLRELTLVKQEPCDARRCELAFRGKPIDRRIFKGTTNLVLSYYSRYFLTVERSGERVRLSGFGIPVLGGEMACPPGLEQRLACKAPRLNTQEERNLVDSVRAEWGYDVSGANEAEMLQGLFDEMRRTRPAAVGATAARPRAIIVAVFDIEDRSGRIGSSTLGQLTEYLSAKVTQLAGYRVIPREQLRTQLVEKKRESYKQCYDQQCQIELGKAVAAEKSLATKLIRAGKTCALTALLYDLKTEATDRAATVKTECTEEALLGGIEQLARQLAGSGS